MRPPTDDPSVAAVISVFNESEDALERTLKAILAQTMQAERVVVVDDGSDRPLRIREGIHADVEVVRLAENVGLAGARNRGARPYEHASTFSSSTAMSCCSPTGSQARSRSSRVTRR